ncbi:MAG: hypothetical protein HUK06_02970 [Bacteroidaceae bacterium]|nr:hypothetical protein [Bacteroidaceae bacterium]
MLNILLFSIVIIAVAVALLSVKILIKPNGKFSSQHVSDNPALRKQGIHCVMKQDKEMRMAADKKLKTETKQI